jgi:hypothetical protein
VHSIRAQFCSLATAFAVLLVSFTCTSAGCLLQLNSSHSQADVATCCVCHPEPGDNHSPAHRCPLCRNSVMLGKTVDNNHSDAAIPFLAPTSLIHSSPGALGAQPVHFVPLPADSPPGGSRTLLALHCSLLT